MTPEWQAAIDSFVEIFSTLDFKHGALYCVLAIVVSGYCCMEGFRIYKMILMGLGFVFGYRVGYYFFSALGWHGEKLLMAEVFLGLILGVVSYKIYLAGVFIAAFQFGQVNLPIYAEAFFGEKLEQFGPIGERVIISVISLVGALIVAKLAVKMSRPVIVCLTAVVGGFAMIYYFVELIPLFPSQLTLPAASSIIWLAAKVILSMMGVGIQGTKDYDI